jgi:tetratricopeptide (TPR) repeat protein
MGARSIVIVVVLAFASSAFAESLSAANPSRNSVIQQASSQTSTQSSPTSSDTQSLPDGYSSSQKGHKAHHVTVEEEVSPPPELGKAEDFIQKRQYSDAEPLLRKVLESDPANYVAWFDLGFTENALGKIDDSIAAYRKSVAAKPDVFESNLNLGLQLAKSGQPDAEQFLRASTQLKPTSHVAEGKARAWISLAQVLEKSKPDEALAAYQQAATLQPKDIEAHLGAGLLFEKQNKFADAEQEYKAAQEIDPSLADAATGLANIYMKAHRLPEAAAALRKVAAAHPEDASAHVQLGRVLAADGKNDDGIAELQTAAKMAPTDASIQRELADLYAESGKNDQAVVAYRGLIAAHPDDADLHRRLGETLLREKKFVDAQQEFMTTVKLKPEMGEAYGDLAFAASENKDYALTLKALDTRIKYLPEIPVTYFLRASAYDHLRDVKKAAANYHLFLNTANGKYPDYEWQAKHRLIALEPKK